MKKNKSKNFIEIMDTTLRDGEQTHGVAISPGEKFAIAQALLEKVKVDRIEIASARVSEGEMKAVKMITKWAKKNKKLNKIEVLGFVDINKSVDWIGEAGGKVINLLTKGSYKHLTEQLRKTPEQHIKDIEKTLDYAKKYGFTCNCYPEAWSTGIFEENDYTDWFIKQLTQLPIARIMLPDTLGILQPDIVKKYISKYIEKYPNTHFDFHAHNDYGLATANILAAVQAGVKGVHTTVNGLGERTGNNALDETVVVIHDFTNKRTNVNEKELFNISKMLETFTGRRVSPNKPISGEAVFTQTAGIHADGDKKGNLYMSKLSPERFNRIRMYALGKLSGKATLDINLDKLGIKLTPEQKKLVLKRVIELGDQKQMITIDDLPFIINDVLKTPEKKIIQIIDALVTTTSHLSSSAVVKVKYKEKEYEEFSTGDGGYDAFMKALKKILKKVDIVVPQLEDYEVRIPPGGKTDALVETTIKWKNGIVTHGVDTDQVKAAIIATENMLNIYLKRLQKNQ